MGNITSVTGDDNLVITYNLLNLPKEIKKSGTVVSKYAYLSDGKKVSSCDAGGNGYMYFGTARFTLDNNVPTFESILFSGGRIVKTSNGYEPQYYLTDHLGSTRMIINKDGKTVEATFDYTPFGVQITGASLPTNSTEYRFSGKELQNISDYEIYDFGARQYFPKYAIWSSVDPLANAFPSVSPYIYCSNNPVNRVDGNGDWDVSVHLYNDRAKYGYGIAIVTDRHGEEVFRFVVRAEGVGGHNRYKEKADTPLGIYNISKKYTWIRGKSRVSYGPNYRLNMEPLDGEIVSTGRTLIRIHGGRQEKFNAKTGQWERVKNPELLETEGCLRAFEDDMIKFKSITDLLQEKDSSEKPGIVRITDDLVQKDVFDNYVSTSIHVTYSVPDNELDYWKKYISDFLNKKR